MTRKEASQDFVIAQNRRRLLMFKFVMQRLIKAIISNLLMIITSIPEELMVSMGRKALSSSTDD